MSVHEKSLLREELEIILSTLQELFGPVGVLLLPNRLSLSTLGLPGLWSCLILLLNAFSFGLHSTLGNYMTFSHHLQRGYKIAYHTHNISLLFHIRISVKCSSINLLRKKKISNDQLWNRGFQSREGDAGILTLVEKQNSAFEMIAADKFIPW